MDLAKSENFHNNNNIMSYPIFLTKDYESYLDSPYGAPSDLHLLMAAGLQVNTSLQFLQQWRIIDQNIKVEKGLGNPGFQRLDKRTINMERGREGERGSAAKDSYYY